MNIVPTVGENHPPTRMTFSGTEPDLFHVLLRGSALQIPTFGFYRFWLITDVRRHLWTHTQVGEDTFEYTGRGKELLFGFLIALGITLVIWLYSRRSPYVAYHARQAGYYQLFVVGFNIFLLFWVLLLFGFYLIYPQWLFVGVIAAWLTGVEAFWFVGSILLGVIGAVLVLLGRSFAYPLFGRK